MRQMWKKIGLGLGLVFMMASPALAQLTDPRPNVPGGFSNLTNSIGTIFTFVITIAGIIFVILFLVGGIQYLTASGDTDATGKAKKILVDAIIGLVIVLSAWAVGNFILSQLGLRQSTTNQAGGINQGGGGSGSKDFLD